MPDPIPPAERPSFQRKPTEQKKASNSHSLSPRQITSNVNGQQIEKISRISESIYPTTLPKHQVAKHVQVQEIRASIDQLTPITVAAKEKAALVIKEKVGLSALDTSQIRRQEILNYLSRHSMNSYNEFELKYNELFSCSIECENIKSFIDYIEEQKIPCLGNYRRLLSSLEPNPQDRDYIKERILNLRFNQIINHIELQDVISEKKQEILEKFSPSDDWKQLKIIDIIFDIAFLENGDSHNKGQVPAKITFHFCKNSEQDFSVMYKPRDSLIDKHVQDLLKACEMPACEILSYKEKGKSFWEYIDGTDMKLDRISKRQSQLKGDSSHAPEAFIKYKLTDSRPPSEKFGTAEKKNLLSKIQKLNNLLLSIDLTDLHGENVRLSTNGDLYIIDAEVFDKDSPTYLMIKDFTADKKRISALKDNAIRELSELEKAKISKWKNEIVDSGGKYKISHRRVLAPTDALTHISLRHNIDEIADEIFNLLNTAIENLKYESTQEEKNSLMLQIKIDLLNNDISFFTESRGIMYHGMEKEGIIVGRAKTNK